MRTRPIAPRVIAPLAALAITAAAVLVGAPGAQSASYRYWSYFLTSDGSWSYANRGPAFHVPADGSVEGWRFGISSGTSGTGLLPRSEPDFERICAQTPAQDERKRVALIVDPGVIEHAPEGDTPGEPWAMCVSAEPRASGFDVLRAATTIRTQRGLICALTDYPTRECTVALQQPAPEPNAPSTAPKPRPENTSSPRPAPSRRPAQPSATPPSTPQPSSTSEVSSNQPVAPTSAGDEREVVPENPRNPKTSASPGVTVPRSNSPSAQSEATPEISIAAAPVTPDSAGPSGWLVVIAAVGIAVLALAGWARARGRRL